MRSIAVALALLMPQDVHAEKRAERLDLAQAYVACSQIITQKRDSEAALRCFINLADKVIAIIPDQNASCSVTDFSFRPHGDQSRFSGAASCQSGRLDYIVRADDGAFLTSGFTFIRGGAFQFFEPLPPGTKSVNLESTVTID